MLSSLNKDVIIIIIIIIITQWTHIYICYNIRCTLIC